MRDIFALFLHVVVTVFRLALPGGFRSVVAESTLIRHQLLILNRGRKRAPNLWVSDRMIAGLCTLLMRPARVLRSAIVLRPSTLLRFHRLLIKRKYRLLFSPSPRDLLGWNAVPGSIARATKCRLRRCDDSFCTAGISPTTPGTSKFTRAVPRTGKETTNFDWWRASPLAARRPGIVLHRTRWTFDVRADSLWFG